MPALPTWDNDEPPPAKPPTLHAVVLTARQIRAAASDLRYLYEARRFDSADLPFEDEEGEADRLAIAADEAATLKALDAAARAADMFEDRGRHR